MLSLSFTSKGRINSSWRLSNTFRFGYNVGLDPEPSSFEGVRNPFGNGFVTVSRHTSLFFLVSVNLLITCSETLVLLVSHHTTTLDKPCVCADLKGGFVSKTFLIACLSWRLWPSPWFPLIPALRISPGGSPLTQSLDCDLRACPFPNPYLQSSSLFLFPGLRLHLPLDMCAWIWYKDLKLTCRGLSMNPTPALVPALPPVLLHPYQEHLQPLTDPERLCGPSL